MNIVASEDNADMLENTIATCVCNEESLPLTSSLLANLLEFLKDDNLNILELKDFLLMDPSLCSQILKMANSAFYGARGEVTSIQRAIDILGIREVLSICLTIAIKQQFSPQKLAKSFEPDLFWKHSLLTAMIARDMATKYDSLICLDGIYLMGLLHDIGRITVATALPDLFDSVAAMSAITRLSLYENEIQQGCSHTELGFLLACKWSLPVHIALAIKYHHNPSASNSHKKELAIVHIADNISKTGEEAHILTHKTPLDESALELLGLTKEKHLKQYELAEKFRALVNSTWETLK